MEARRRAAALAVWLGLSCLPAGLGDDPAGPPAGRDSQDFTNLSLEELGAINVTTVSKKSEPLSRVPAAVTVITGDEIRRSGALNIPEALRLAPGIEAARVDSWQWAVTARGFNDTFAQKLLVLADGRSIYTPMFSGTYWQAHGAFLDDIDRIEVVRGPGGTVWGANAVNGVINIVSKPARETQGTFVWGGGGSDNLASAGVRYGGRLGTNAYFRAYGMYEDWGQSQLVSGGDSNDAWVRGQGGIRMDWEPVSGDRWTLQGDLFALDANQQVPVVELPAAGLDFQAQRFGGSRPETWGQHGGNILGRWTRTFEDESELSAQAYFDHGRLDTAISDETRDTYDLDVRHRVPLGTRHEVMWGGGYRLSESSNTPGLGLTLQRAHRADQVVNSFVQDEIKIVPDRLQLTLGTKIEHNDYSGFEYEPGARMAWTPTERQTVWFSVARAVRTPAQVEHDMNLLLTVLPPDPRGNPVPTVVSVVGNPDYGSESLIAYETGYRWMVNRRLTLEMALFYNTYDDLRQTETRLNQGQLPRYLVVENVFVNRAAVETYGGEMALTWKAASFWWLHLQGSLLKGTIKGGSSAGSSGGVTLLASPEYQAAVRSTMDLGRNVQLHLWTRYTGRIASAGLEMPGLATVVPSIPEYVTFDARIGWRLSRSVELSIVGQNLSGAHREFNPTYITSQFTEVARSVFAKLTWAF